MRLTTSPRPPSKAPAYARAEGEPCFKCKGTVQFHGDKSAFGQHSGGEPIHRPLRSYGLHHGQSASDPICENRPPDQIRYSIAGRLDQEEYRHAQGILIRVLIYENIARMTKLRAIRERKGVTLRMLANMSGVALATLVRIEGSGYDPRLSTLRKLAKALEVSVAELIGEQLLKKGGRQWA